MTAKVRRIDFSPDEWLGGTRRLTFEQEGFYIRVCALIYSNGGPLPHGDLAHACRADPRSVARLLGQLVALGKIRENGDGTLTVPRCEVELTSARLRAEVAEKNAAKRWENIKTHDARARTREAEVTPAEVSQKKPAKCPEENNTHDARVPAREAAANCGDFRTSPRLLAEVGEKFDDFPNENNDRPYANHQPSVRKIASPKELAILPYPHTPARETTPPLPSQGDGVAASRSPTPEPAAATVFDDPELKAYGIAAFERCLEALRTKRTVLVAAE